MKFDFELTCDQLNSTNHSLPLEVSSSVPCPHILTECICSCTYMDTLPLILVEMKLPLHIALLQRFLPHLSLQLYTISSSGNIDLAHGMDFFKHALQPSEGLPGLIIILVYSFWKFFQDSTNF